MIFFNIVLALVLLIVFLLGCLFLITPLFSKIPSVSTRRKVLKQIVEVMDLRDGSVLYDLGCGDGRVLFSALGVYKDITCIGVEKAPFPFLIAKLHQFFSPNKNISIIYGDMFKAEVSSATHIFLYLLPGFMDTLLPKLEKELKPGARVFSCDFQFSKRKPDLVINLSSKKYQLSRRLYVYDF